MPVGAPYGNRNAEKWTFKKAIRLFRDAIELSDEEETYFLKHGEKAIEVSGFKYDFIGEIAKELGTYHNLITRDLPKRFPALQRLKNQLLNNLESNCYANGKRGTIKEASSIMNLKSNHRWTDRLDNTTKDEKINDDKKISVTIYSDKGKRDVNLGYKDDENKSTS